ncbi:hypothetical protein B0H19DRAFT_1140250 [Mycena capillaripes]|nr:hypothetical protein B0H19DRAFT_1140250 [Mycena capillaripes]
MSEAAYLIWRLRNEHLITRDGQPAMEQEIVNRWNYDINYRLQVDITLANRPPNGKKPVLAPKKILEPWEPRVLVGGQATHTTQPNNGIR